MRSGSAYCDVLIKYDKISTFNYKPRRSIDVTRVKFRSGGRQGIWE